MDFFVFVFLERLRDLFEQAVADVPADDAPEFYIKYAKAEVILMWNMQGVLLSYYRLISRLQEQYGLARHAVAIYDRATKVVVPNKRLDMFRLYAKKVKLIIRLLFLVCYIFQTSKLKFKFIGGAFLWRD